MPDQEDRGPEQSAGTASGLGGNVRKWLDPPGKSPAMPHSQSQPPGREPRYCAACGEIFTERDAVCPDCGTAWQPYQLWPNPAVLAGVLEELRQLHAAGRLDDGAYAVLRSHFEPRLVDARPPRRRPDPAAAPAVPASDVESEPSPERVTEPLLPNIAGWAAARQADILLYLGAFLLSISALVFVGYQGGALGGAARFALLLAYTTGFIALGLQLPRWQRVREAGTVFLALGAVLVPVNFIALRTQVLGGQVPVSLIWLAGAGFSAALYFTLDLRGFGRLYRYPGLVAALCAWGALGAAVHLPDEWFGAWFAGLAVAMHELAAGVEAPLRERVQLGAEALGAGALFAAHIAAAAGGRDRAELPATYLLISAGVGAAVLHGRRSVPELAALPAVLSLTALTAWWSSFGLNPVWYGCFAAAAAAGYLVNARLDREERTERWLVTAATTAAFALALTHLTTVTALTTRTAHTVHRSVLPITYAELLAGAAVAYACWRRREALAAIPALAAGLGITGGWALRLVGLEWIGAWSALAALGYLGAVRVHPSERGLWRSCALQAGALAVVAGQIAAGLGGTVAWQLPVAYALLLAGCGWAAFRDEDPVALALVPVLAVAAVDAALWAGGVGPRWWAYPGLAATAGVIGAAAFWRGRPAVARYGWAYALAGADLLPPAFSGVYIAHPAHGMSGFGLAAVLLALIAVGSRGAIARLLVKELPAQAPAVERAALSLLAFAWLFVAAAYFNAWVGTRAADRAVVFAVLGGLTWLALAGAGRAWPELFWSSAPTAAVMLGTAAGLARADAALMMLYLALGTAGPAAAFPGTRRWSLWLVAAAFGTFAIGGAWRWGGYGNANLSLCYAACAAVLWAGLTRLRGYSLDGRGVVVAALSWVPWIIAIATALQVLTDREAALPAGGVLAHTREWAALAIDVGAAGAALVAEGAPLRSRALWMSGSAVMMVAVLLGIAVGRPGTVQAYTLPVGVYVLALGFSFRTSRDLVEGQLTVHEAFMVAGALALTLPPAVLG